MSAEDDQHLHLLAVFHYVLGGIGCLFSLVPLVHIAMGVAIITGSLPMQATPNGDAIPRFMGWIFVAMGALLMLIGWTMSLLLLRAGHQLSRRRSHLFCMIVAGFACAAFPIGTALGVFTIIVLQRESVKALFRAAAAEPAG